MKYCYDPSYCQRIIWDSLILMSLNILPRSFMTFVLLNAYLVSSLLSDVFKPWKYYWFFYTSTSQIYSFFFPFHSFHFSYSFIKISFLCCTSLLVHVFYSFLSTFFFLYYLFLLFSFSIFFFFFCHLLFNSFPCTLRLSCSYFHFSFSFHSLFHYIFRLFLSPFSQHYL